VFTQSTRCAYKIFVKLEFSRQIFEKNNQISIFMKFRLVGAELLHADERTGG
jgi:hypothetical protein